MYTQAFQSILSPAMQTATIKACHDTHTSTPLCPGQGHVLPGHWHVPRPSHCRALFSYYRQHLTVLQLYQHVYSVPRVWVDLRVLVHSAADFYFRLFLLRPTSSLCRKAAVETFWSPATFSASFMWRTSVDMWLIGGDVIVSVICVSPGGLV